MRWPWQRDNPSGLTRPEAETSQTVEVVPGELLLRVVPFSFKSQSENVDCWVMRSNGLLKCGHKEIVLIPVLRDDEVAPGISQISALLRSIHQHAKAGNRADVGGYTKLDPNGPGLFGRYDFKGLIYTCPYALLSPELDATTLHAVVLTSEEFVVARECGHTRVLARLGQHYRYFPTPPWCDPYRPHVLSQKDVKSIVRKTARMEAYDCVGWMTGTEWVEEAKGSPGEKDDRDRLAKWNDTRVSLVMAKSIRTKLADALRNLPNDVAFTLLTGVRPGIERCWVWPPKKGSGNAISVAETRDQRIAGNFVTFLPNQEHASARVIEDGFAVLMTKSDWERLKAALMGGKNATITTEIGKEILGMSWV